MSQKTINRTVSVCDQCEREGYIYNSCVVCKKELCITCPALVPGCIISVPICNICSERDDVEIIFKKWAPKINAPRIKRDAELAVLESRKT